MSRFLTNIDDDEQDLFREAARVTGFEIYFDKPFDSTGKALNMPWVSLWMDSEPRDTKLFWEIVHELKKQRNARRL